MLLRAANDFNIELSESWMIGDGMNDIIAGNAAGCRTVLIGSDDQGQDLTPTSLLQAIREIADAEFSMN